MKLISFILCFCFGLQVSAAGLTIHVVDMGVAKFHRQDNQNHPYASDNKWFNYILDTQVQKLETFSKRNGDGSFTITFVTLEDLFNEAIRISQQTGQKVQVLNINSHGLPGGVWFPKDITELNDSACKGWISAATKNDEIAYAQYYTAIGKNDILSLRRLAQNPQPTGFGCVANLKVWTEMITRIPNIRSVFAPDAQVNFLSCLVGLGNAVATFATGLAKALLPDEGAIRTSLNFGLGDWSMPEGMGFWDYLNDAQLSHDNQVYPVEKRDRSILQKGQVRLVSQIKGVWQSAVQDGQDFLLPSFQTIPKIGLSFLPRQLMDPETLAEVEAQTPQRIRIPGTGYYTER